LGPQWQWQANHGADWASLAARPGFLRLRALGVPDADLALAPHLLLQKLPARSFSLETRVELGAGAELRAGLVVMGKRHAAWVVMDDAEEQQLCLIVDNELLECVRLPRRPIRLWLEMADGGLCRFGYRLDGEGARALGATFQAEAGRWIGAKVGLFAASHSEPAGFADFEYFRFAPPAAFAGP
jgi:beta-xylosidase